MKSEKKKNCKRRAEAQDELVEFVQASPLKKRKTCILEEEQQVNGSKSEDPNSGRTRLLRRNSTIQEKVESEGEDKIIKKKEKENSIPVKSKSHKKKKRSPDEVLKNVKTNSLTHNGDNSEMSDNDMPLLSVPKTSNCRKSLKCIYESISIDENNSSNEALSNEAKCPTNKECGGKQSFDNAIKSSAPTTPLEKARHSLHVSSVPESLPCREREFKNIFSFLQNKLLDGIGGCMYISGVPGTGKTATATQVIRKLKSMAETGNIPQFKFIEINGMRLADPRKAYILLWQGLTGKKTKISAEQAQRNLDGWFSRRDAKAEKMPTLLLVDELDLICTKKQDVVYNLLDWPTKSPSHLIVLTIANTMDMPERLFKGRVTSRLGLTRLTFLPYTYKQLEQIVMARLTGLNAFTLDAVRLVTRKVAAVSGDARRSLDICRRATELPGPEETVKISHIEQAIKEMTNSNSVKIVKSCSQLEKLFLRSVSEISKRTGIEEVDMRDVMEHFLALSTLEGYPRLPVSHILYISNRLKCFRLIFTNNLQSGILQRLTLNISEDDIHYGIMCK